MKSNTNQKRLITIIAVAVILLIVFFVSQITVQKLDMKKGQECLAEKQYEKAFGYFQTAEDRKTIFTSKKNIQYYQGECLLYLGRYKEAAGIYHKIDQKHKEVKASTLEGFAYQRVNFDKKAEDCYKRAIKEDKQDGMGYYYLFGFYIDNKKYEQALEVAETALKLPVKTRKKDLKYAQIVAYEKLLDYKSALKSAKEYCKDYPEDKQGKREKEFLETR